MMQAHAFSPPEEESSHSGSVELPLSVDVPLRQGPTSLLKQVEIYQRNVCFSGVSCTHVASRADRDGCKYGWL